MSDTRVADYKTSSPEEKDAILNLLELHGAEIGERMRENYYPVLTIRNYGKRIRINGNQEFSMESIPVELPVFIELAIEELDKIKRRVELELSNDYNAEYTKGDEHVVVGCQKIKVDTIRQLLKTIDELNK